VEEEGQLIQSGPTVLGQTLQRNWLPIENANVTSEYCMARGSPWTRHDDELAGGCGIGGKRCRVVPPLLPTTILMAS